MQQIEEFNDNFGTAILLCGGAGAGKTSLAMRLFPKTYVFVADLNFKSGIDYLKKLKQTGNIVGYDMATPNEEGKIVPSNQRYDRMLRKLNAAIADPNIDCIVIDSATFIEDIIKAKICGAIVDEAIKLEGFGHWGSLVLLWKSLVMQLRQSGKKIIMTAHITKEKDESDNTYKYQIAVDGSIRGKFPAYFSDVWFCEVTENMGTHTWNARTLGNNRQDFLKNTYGLAGLLKQDDLIVAVRKHIGILPPSPTPVTPAPGPANMPSVK